MASNSYELEVLGARLTKRRKQRIDEVLSRRIGSIVVVFENLHKVHNLSAVLRTAEGLGIQEVHIVGKPEEGWELSKGVTQGAHKWLTIKKWHQIDDAVAELKGRGFVIAASVLSPQAIPLDEFDPPPKLALLFGNELDGLTPHAIELADLKFVIPMYGFVQSFNVSVACAITLWEIVKKVRKRTGGKGDLPKSVQDELRLAWYRKSVKHAEEILERISEYDETTFKLDEEQ